MSWLASLNLSSYLDIHQCPGVLKENVNYESFARAMGVSPGDIKEGVTVPIEVCVCVCVCVCVSECVCVCTWGRSAGTSALWFG